MMNDNEIKVMEIKHASKEYKQVLKLREEILRKPLGMVYNPDDLAKENNSFHLACNKGGEFLACLILKPISKETLQMRQVAVKKAFQSQGYGKILVEYSEKFAKEHGYKEIILHSRETAVGFYEKLGYKKEGERFIEIGLSHFMMRKPLN